MSLPSRFFGILFKPAGTFRMLVDHPVWLDALALVLVAAGAFSYLAFPYVQQGRLLRFERRSAAFIEAHGEEQYAAAVDRIRGESRALRSFVVCPLTLLTGTLFISLIALGAGRTFARRGHYLQVFSCFLHAGFTFNIVGRAVSLGLAAARGSTLRISTGLPAFFSGPAPGSIAYAALNQVDPFALWMYGLFGWGLAAAFKTNARRGLAISYALWLAQALAAVALAFAENEFFF